MRWLGEARFVEGAAVAEHCEQHAGTVAGEAEERLGLGLSVDPDAQNGAGADCRHIKTNHL
jgi:hypothetical protein